MKITHNFVQGSPEWYQHRATHDNASDAVAAAGESEYVTRSAFLKQRATGVFPEIDPVTQKRFDKGHEYEEQARPWAEEIIGQDLYPCIQSCEIDGLPLSASYDGLVMDESICFEHKTLNATLEKSLSNGIIPDQYKLQMEQQMLISGAEKCLFMSSNGNKETMKYAWYESDPAIRAKLLSVWKQFHADLANYQHVEVVAEVVAKPQETLPALSINVSGNVALHNNLDVFGEALKGYIAKQNTSPETDQDFADLDAAAKNLRDVQSRIAAARDNARGQIADYDAMDRLAYELEELSRTSAIKLENLVKSEKENRRAAIVKQGQEALKKHIEDLNTRLGKSYMPTVQADFAGAIKGKRTIASLHDAVDTTLANAKIEASAIADRIEINIKFLRENAADFAFLFSDTAQICLKANDDFANLAKSRIDTYKAEEIAKIQREEIAARVAAERAAQTVIDTAKATQAPAPAPIAAPVAKPVIKSEPTLKLGTINERLGFTCTADFMKSLGFEGKKVKGAFLFHEADFMMICDAIKRRIDSAMQKLAA